ncbi:MAG: TonB-dependent receptor domain-containing protein [Ferruginibacter sp.]
MVRLFKNGIAVCITVLLFSTAVFAQEPAKPTGKLPETPKVDTTHEEAKEAVLDNIPIVSVDENDTQDGSSQNVSSQLSAGRDPYFNGASFHFNAVRFRLRGYDNDLFSTNMNGVQMENLDNGFTPFGLWGGLNDVIRNRDASLGLRPTTYGIGDLGGMTAFDVRASRQRKQTSVNYASSNRNYFNRIMVTHSSGLNKHGWAYTISGSRRWAEEGYVAGTYYDGYSAFLAVDKRVNDRHLLSFVGFVTPTENGRQGSAVAEMAEIAGDKFYNPFWGYQNGKKRNVSVAKTNQPVFILTHDWKVTDKTTLITAASYIFGKRNVTGFDWYNSADPRPDYYRYLPSYQTEPVQRDMVYDAMKNDVNLRQINWDRLYNANYGNYETINDVNGIAGNSISGKRSVYIVEDRIVNTNRINVNTTLNTTLSTNIDFTAGASYQFQRNNYYKQVNDLLGGDFYVDLNQFAERDFASDPNASQNDVNNPNRILKVGDKFGYNYDITIKRAAAWAQAVVKFRKIDFFIAGEHSYTSFFRTGNTKVGLFPNNSFGKSKVNNFYNYNFKGGVTYKINGRNYLYANSAYITRAPFFDNAYIAPRTRDIVLNDLKSEQIFSAEAGYAMNAPNLKIRLTGFYTNFKNQSNVLTFYDEQFRNFVNYALSNIGKEHFGIEFGAEAKIYKGLSVNAAANIGRYFYTTRQNITITQDNTNEQLASSIVYSKNFRVPTPQEAYTIGLAYRSPKFWFVNVNFNYFDQMWFDFNPARRTYAAVEGIDPASTKWRGIIDQTRLDAQYTVDAFFGYSWRMNNKFKSLKKPTYLVFNVGVNNLLNNTNIVSGGFEQLRFDFQERNINKFPVRKFYAYGANYFASVGVRF